MQTFLIISRSKEAQEKEVEKLLVPFHIDAFDIAKIVPEQSIGIGSIREVKRLISLKPYRSHTKAVVIKEAQTLTIEAQNALLKTLEEPPEHTIIILLVSTNVEALLPTVISRCQVIQLPTTNPELLKDEVELMAQQLAVFLENGVGERLVLAEKVTKDRETATSWLENMILISRQKLLDTVQKSKEGKTPTTDILVYLQYIRLFQHGHTILTTTNVNPRLTLETLFLSLG